MGHDAARSGRAHKSLYRASVREFLEYGGKPVAELDEWNREMLRLEALGYSRTRRAASVRNSCHTVKTVLVTVASTGVSIGRRDQQ